jgi:hypothetical protein|tara:strand:+ start:1058 stop:1780 length:723 start_codon:yes stop_codon:yes gene_type:complete
MKKTLLELVQSILSDMDSEPVNSISDSIEAEQIASVIEDTYFNFVSSREIPEHRRLIKITALSDNTKPTHFKYVGRQLYWIRYNIDENSQTNYREIKYMDPGSFATRNLDTSNVTTVYDASASTNLLILNDRMPSLYTSFDDEHIVMDAFKSSVESTLQTTKTQAYGIVTPTFSLSDTFEPDIDEDLIPYLLAEAKSACFSLFKSGSDPKVEQSARRLKSFVTTGLYRTKQENVRNNYGR